MFKLCGRTHGHGQRRTSPSGLVYAFGWTATVGLATLSRTHNTYAIGALLAAMAFTATPANAMLFAVQIHSTPQTPTFLAFATIVATITIVMHLSTTIRTMRRPDDR